MMRPLRSTMRSLGVPAVLLLVVSLSGCGIQKAQAVKSAHAELLATIQRHDLNKAQGVAGLRTELSALYDESKAIAIGDCPEDYQAQFREVVNSLGEVSKTAAGLPDSMSPSDLEAFKAKLSTFEAAANKLDDVAKQYITIQ